jgi:DNA polymerase III subunit epsilon
MGFLNAELKSSRKALISNEQVIDTLLLARKKHPLGPNSLDALCKRYGVDNSRRTKHGALLDSELLSEVYLELIGGRQVGFNLKVETIGKPRLVATSQGQRQPRATPLAPRLSPDEKARHDAIVAGLGVDATWRKSET